MRAAAHPHSLPCAPSRAPGHKTLRELSLRRAALLFLLILIPSTAVHAAAAPGKEYFDIAKSIELFGDVYQEVSENYVDSLNVSEFMYAGIDGMLDKLDPYTTFLDEEQSDALDELTSGQYAGIGITIGLIDRNVYIMSVIDGYAASRAGLKVGDRITSINRLPVRKMPLDSIRTQIKGAAGTKVTLGIERLGQSPVTCTLPRQEVRVNTINYSGLLGPYGYIEMNNFGQRSADELGTALRGLQAKAGAASVPLKGLILDLRSNPGGLLNVAVDVTGIFVPKGSRVVSTRGRTKESEKVYVTEQPPIVTALPLAVLINRESASAAEILAGAIQDHDRGVVLGERSFGKGLVQSVIKLPYDHALKLTTAKYYTPSGRLIQKPHERTAGERKVLGSGAVTTDSLKVFYTDHRRKVYSGGGINPDLAVSANSSSEYEKELQNKGMYFRYALRYHATHPEYSEADFTGGKHMKEFNVFLDREKFRVRLKPQQQLDSLKLSLGADAAQTQGGIGGSIELLEKELASLAKKRFMADSTNIAANLRQEILRHYNETAARRMELDRDPAVLKAIEILGSGKKYRALLTP